MSSTASGGARTCGAPAPREVSRLQIGERPLQVLCVDELVPRQLAARDAARPRQCYVDGEIAHFELDGHRYALVRLPRQDGDDVPGADGLVPPPDDIRRLLTNRELQIVQLICMGCLTKQVADRLRLSEFTVRSYLKTVYCKLGVRSRGAMVYRYAQAFRRPGEARD